MDVSRSRFPFELVSIIQLIANSHFVAFDLEFSGIASWRRGQKKPTLQEVYEDVKGAAEQYQVLQVGLTVVQEDLIAGCYIARPYNFNINPIPASEKLHFERIWSFQSGAVDFLLRNGFHFDRPYTYGVPYLSRKDEVDINAAWIAVDKQKAALADMQIKVEDAVLVNHVRASVEKWQKQPPLTRESYLNIPDTSDGGVHYAAESQILNRYQIRLVHQIVRNEYPALKTTGKGHFIQITPFDDARDMNEKLQQARYRERDILRAIEFRWLIEAISGGDITRMPSEYFINALSSDVKPTGDDSEALRKFIDDLQQQLNSRRRILVGHNCFMDLIYLYRCFIGELPSRLEDFQELIREMFPAVVDTKYIASFGESWQSTSLQEVEENLPTEGVPRVEVPAEFDRYAIGQSLHEAGYDSLLTAKIAIKLSAKLEKEAKFPANKHEDALNPENATTDDDGDDDGVSEHYITAAESIADSEAGNLTAMVTNVLSAPITAIGNFFRSDLAATGQQFVDNQDRLINDQLEDLMVFSNKEKDKGEEMSLLEVNGEGDVVREPFQRTSTESLDHAASPKLPDFKTSDKVLTKAEILEKGKAAPLFKCEFAWLVHAKAEAHIATKPFPTVRSSSTLPAMQFPESNNEAMMNSSSSGSSTVTMSTATHSLSNSEYLSSQLSLGPSKKASSEISKTYKEASQLFLTRRLSEALSVLQPAITPPTQPNDNANGEQDAPPLAPIATATQSQRIKVWSLYVTLMNSIVDLGNDEGRRDFGQKEYKALVAKVRDGEIWEQILHDGYNGREGSVDAEVVYNLATLLLGQGSSQTLNQSRLETYLAASSHPNLDISSHLVKSSPRQLDYRVNGADTPKELSSRLKILELFTLHVLPRNEEWDYARSFINNSDILDDERREAFLQTLQELQEAMDTEDRAVEPEFHRERDEESKRQQEEEERNRAHTAAEELRKAPEQNGGVHRRSGSEVDYGIEKSHPSGTSTFVNVAESKPAVAKSRPTPGPASGRTQFSPPPETPKHRPVRKSPQSHSNDMLTQARQLVRALQSLMRNVTGAVTSNPTTLFRAFLFVLAILMAFSRREVRERVRRIVSSSWDKIRGTVGMGVKVSYI